MRPAPPPSLTKSFAVLVHSQKTCSAAPSTGVTSARSGSRSRKGDAPYFVGALAVAVLGYTTLGPRLGWLSLLLALPLVVIAPPRAIRRALARDYPGFRILAVELQGKRETMVSRSARRRAEEWAQRLGIPPAPDPPPDAGRPQVEIPIDRERAWRIYLVTQLWEAVLIYGALLVVTLPRVLLANAFPDSWGSATSLTVIALWLAIVIAGSLWSLRKALENTYPDFHLVIEATGPAADAPSRIEADAGRRHTMPSYLDPSL